MKKLICKVFGHSVQVTHTNPYQIPTREKCSICGLSRTLENIEGTNCFRWIYSDGRKSIGVRIFTESEIKFGDIQ